MAAPGNFTPISLYYSITSGHVPAAANLVLGELALNVADGNLFYKDNSGTVQKFNIGNYTDSGFWQNIQTISSNQAITVGYNAESVGPITIAGGVTVTVPSGSRWLVL